MAATPTISRSAQIVIPSQAIQIALKHHQAGRLSEAEPIYQQILAVEPDHADALNLLGVIAHKSGRNETAVELIGKAIQVNPSNSYYLNGLGEAYRAMLMLDPAIECYRKAITLQPKLVEAHYNLGLALKEKGDFVAAEASYRKALKLNPNFAEAYGNLGNVIARLGRLDEAVPCYRKALKLNPNVAEVHFNLGNALMSLGKVAAISCFQEAIRLESGNPLYLGAFSRVLFFYPNDVVDYVDQSFVLLALKNTAVDPYKLSAVIGKLVCRAPLIQRLMAASEAGEGMPKLEALLDAGTLRQVAGMPLLLALLEDAVVSDWRLECVLTDLRQVLLGKIIRAETATDQVLNRFVCALALQCFSNDYVWLESEGEAELLAELEKRITGSIEKDKDFPELWLVLLAAYRALYRTGLAERLSSRNWSDERVQAVIKRQLWEPRQEEDLKQTITALNRVEDEVSLAVRRQYEENPYPRWTRVGDSGGEHPTDDRLEKLDILVAGGGTGSHSIGVALRYKNANIVAVDLSLASLAYAKRATAALGIANIEYQQADILKLNLLDRQFDVIECVGVLHHMKEPLAGWRNLEALLRPGGRMRIGLYSRRARREVTLTRQRITELGYAPTLDKIRRCRREIMTEAAGFTRYSFVDSMDFFSTSTCRDLLFHVQEHQFSPLEIQACLDQLGLEFGGFLVSPQTMQRYTGRFPRDPRGLSLGNWELFEEENPDTFWGMFQFWVTKGHPVEALSRLE